MPATTIFCGVLLIIVGVTGYVYGMMNEHASITALIPAFFGIVLIVLGAIAQMSEGIRKHLMHAAMTVALIGFILTAGRLLMNIQNISLTAAVAAQAAMAIICLALVLLGINSFIAARRERGEL